MIERSWEFSWDMNKSGIFTTRDLEDIFLWLLFYPGDFIIHLVLTQVSMAGDFFELPIYYYGGFVSGILSLAVWAVGLIILYQICTFPFQKKAKRSKPIVKQEIKTRPKKKEKIEITT